MYSKNLSPREREALFATGARRVFGALVHPDSLVLLLVLGVNTSVVALILDHADYVCAAQPVKVPY